MREFSFFAIILEKCFSGEENGKFKKIEDIQNVKGIGDAKYDGIKDEITVK